MKARKSSWVDLKTLKEKFGIQVHFKGQWLNASEGSGALIFDSEAERDLKLAEIKKKPELEAS
jgi:hypothetical protein